MVVAPGNAPEQTRVRHPVPTKHLVQLAPVGGHESTGRAAERLNNGRLGAGHESIVASAGSRGAAELRRASGPGWRFDGRKFLRLVCVARVDPELFLVPAVEVVGKAGRNRANCAEEEVLDIEV